VMITLGREKLMQHMLLGVHEATEQCVVVVFDELSFRWRCRKSTPFMTILQQSLVTLVFEKTE